MRDQHRQLATIALGVALAAAALAAATAQSPPSDDAARVALAAPTGIPSGPTTTATTLTLRGLRAPVEIIRDRWGINHIYAETEYDLFFAQGYAAARDRLFQFEVWRDQSIPASVSVMSS